MKVNIHEAKTHLSKLAQRVKAGETIILCDRNVPFGELRPISQGSSSISKRPLGFDKGKVVFAEDWDSDETNLEIAADFGLEGEGK